VSNIFLFKIIYLLNNIFKHAWELPHGKNIYCKYLI
jgi:hypothetical protein